ncbi:hypothetical protein ACWGDT_32620 [Streptomyces avermitilis]
MNGTPTVVNGVMTRTLVASGTKSAFKGIVETVHEARASALPVLDDDGRVVGSSPRPIGRPRSDSARAPRAAADRRSTSRTAVRRTR